MPTILNAASGSANPATSLSALWAYLQPALDHIVKSPSTDINGKAPAIDFGLYAGIHSACYNYFTVQSEANAINTPTPFDSQQPSTSGTDIYVQLDKYFSEAAREVSLGAPLDDVALVKYIISSFNRFHAGAQSSNRLLSYVNRHYVKRAVDEDRGWIRLTDVLDSNNNTADDSREIVSRKFREKRLVELKKWGYHTGDPPEKVAFAESCAEAASPPDRIIPVLSLAHRRFRMEFVEPLLAAPKLTAKNNSKAKNKIPKTPVGVNPARPKGRLARAVHNVLESDAVDEEERIQLLSGLATALQTVGVREEHSLRKKLDKYMASAPALVTPSPPLPPS